MPAMTFTSRALTKTEPIGSVSRTRNHRQLLTCRYWALGPCCPDIDSNNTQTCSFAHWDTGQLADFAEQRGTCFDWFYKDSCRHGRSCSDEHRDTGVMGLNQGALILHGLNLDVADAANRAGFDTRDRVALTELIWAVRRTAFRHATVAPKISRPPRHPVYPDHYRPGDPSDNTRRKRKRRNRVENKTSNTGDSVANLIDLHYDSVGEGKSMLQVTSSTKRLKASVGSSMGRYKVELPARPRLETLEKNEHQTILTSSHNIAPMLKDSSHTNTDMSDRVPSPRPRNLLSPSPALDGPILKQSLTKQPKTGDLTIVQLDHVKCTLVKNISSIHECSNAMMATYESDDRLSTDIIYTELGILKGKFDSCARGAEDGIKIVEKVIGVLGDEHVEMRDEMVNHNNDISSLVMLCT